MIKRGIRVAIVLLSAVMTAVLPSPAQQSTSPASGAMPGEAASGQLPSPEEVSQWLGQQLQLTEPQQAQVTPILVARRQKIEALRDDASLRRMERMRRAKQIFDESNAQIERLLTSEQKQKFEQVKQQMRERAQQMRNSRSAQ